MESAPASEGSPRADLVGALVWMAIGAAIAIGGWRMDRLEHLHINHYEVPGLVPGLLGAALLLLGLLLAWRAIAQGALRRRDVPAAPAVTRVPAAPTVAGRGRMALVIGSMLLYALVLVGHGLPFWFSTALFVSAFIFYFDRERQTALGRGARGRALLALACGVAASVLVTLVFQELFYVRLP